VPLEQVEVRENATGSFLAAAAAVELSAAVAAAVAWMGLGSSRSSCCWH